MKTFSSCLDPNPMVLFEGQGAAASIINYNLPASTAFTVRRYVPIDVPHDWWTDDALEAPGDTPWKGLKEQPRKDKPEPITISDFAHKEYRTKLPPPGPPPGDPIDQLPSFHPAVREWVRRYPSMAPLLALERQEPLQPISGTYKRQSPKAVQMDELNQQLAVGRVPVFHRTLYGNYRRSFVPDPGKAQPGLVIVEEYEVASFLGDYGAGRTLKTFSLLPGETTVISIRSYRSVEETKTKSENILDSFSQDSSDELEQIINQEQSHNTTQEDATSTGFSETESWGESGGGGTNAGIDIGIVQIGGEAKVNISHNTDTTNTQTANSSRSEAVGTLHKAMDRHVAQSSLARQIDVNTETTAALTTKTETETTTTRELNNINRSRVLNFVFRQLTQEYLTITYLKRVRIGFTKGYPADGRTSGLDNIDRFLTSIIKKEHVKDISTAILDELSNVIDHTGTPQTFIEPKEEKVNGKIFKYYRKRPAYGTNALVQEWKGKSVEGVILDTATRILATDAVIVEALLGQGEALDCYNMQLQDAAVVRAQLDNRRIEAGIGAVTQAASSEQPDAYRKVFGEVCCCCVGRKASQTADV